MSTLLQETEPPATGAAARLAGVLSGIALSPLSDSARSATIQRLLHALGVGLASTRLDPYAVTMRALAGECGASTVLAARETLSAGGAA